jgi:hypothetical protein
VITGSYAVMPPRTLRVRPGVVVAHVEPAIDSRAHAPHDVEGLLAKVQTVFRRHFAPSGPAPSA